MKIIKVGIIEDEMIIALGISEALQEFGYEVTEPCNNYADALQMVRTEKPDVLLMDIQLKGEKDGIDIAMEIKNSFNIPFIFLTENTDKETVDRAKNVAAHAYLVKPFRKEELYTSIEICFHNFSAREREQKLGEDNNIVIRDSIFIKQGQYLQKVNFDDILYMESENNYVKIHTRGTKLLYRGTLQECLDLTGSKQFMKVHRSYAVNVKHIQSINPEFVVINKAEIPVSKSYFDQLISYLKIG